MSGISELATTVETLAARADGLDAAMGDAARRLRDLSNEAHRRAGQSEAGYEWRSAAASIDAAVAAVQRASQYSSACSVRGRDYAAFLVTGGGVGATVGTAVTSPTGQAAPVSASDVADRTSDNRVDLADNAPATDDVPDFGGYLDVVMHGDAEGTAANIRGADVDFSFDDVVALVEGSPSWQRRPIRLMSCSTGQGDYAQRLADRLGVTVYAPSDVLSVAGGVKRVLNDGTWVRFEPST